ncbi:hypothetical protein [Bacillus mycoides]|uniref:hypothetical protein n=1 Tax=Bacillus mycoides TaxID=1405 RepID=UPI0010566748|nr:hypothetical protein [Bacillus mycoides]
MELILLVCGDSLTLTVISSSSALAYGIREMLVLPQEEEKEILVTDISFWEFYFHNRIVRLYWISFIYRFGARHWQKRRGSTSNYPK